MDALRMALNEEQLNYLGASYGAELGAAYASLFPTRVGSFVLDAGPSPDAPSGPRYVDQATSVEARLAEFFSWCSDGRCALAADGRSATARAAYDEAVAMVDAGQATGGRRPLVFPDVAALVASRLNSGVARYQGTLYRFAELG